LQASTNAANRNNVSLYSVDARGLLAETPGGDASTGMATGTSSFSGAAVSNKCSRGRNRATRSRRLAEDTGGKAFFDQGDFGKIFREVEDENTGYYLLNYYSTNVKRDGRYRRVRVKLVNVPGGHVKIPRRYYAPKDWGIYSTEDREKQLDDAMASTRRWWNCPSPYKRRNSECRTGKSSCRFPRSSPRALCSGRKNAGVARRSLIFWPKSPIRRPKRVASSLRDTMTVRLDTERFQQVQQQAMVYQGGFLLSPGKYHLKFLARENASGRVGTFEQDLLLPPPTPNRLSLSTVMLSNQIGAGAENSGSAAQGAGRGRAHEGLSARAKWRAHRAQRDRRFHGTTDALRFLPGVSAREQRSGKPSGGTRLLQGGKQSNTTAMVEPQR